MLTHMTAAPLPFRCSCGNVRGSLVVPHAHAGTRCVCYCSDCQAFLRHLGHEERLDAWGGTELFQTSPRYVKLEDGTDQLRCLKLTENGVLRWFTACCKSPIANTTDSVSAPFAALFVSNFEERSSSGLDRALGPIRYRTQGREARGTPAAGTHPRNSLGHILRTVRFLLQWRLSGHARPTPFFDDAGRPVSPIERVYETA